MCIFTHMYIHFVSEFYFTLYLLSTKFVQTVLLYINFTNYKLILLNILLFIIIMQGSYPKVLRKTS
jgi:hypothetical protein